ncbi:hypothetical protein [Herbiconiux daphne]|uniref:Uncharacterized protein n=1 Tax=Herbiconiux daphne TaxID=2970914 RepID=A0ABT2HBD0_9MICO|nr:hypothetical protein [Herbiconiux daphne]MCS5737254.1 hypothetical protein [Herbiconiux daphne]
MKKDTQIKIAIALIPTIIAGGLAFKKAKDFKKLSEAEQAEIREQNKREEEASELAKEEPVIAAGMAGLSAAQSAQTVIENYDNIKQAAEKGVSKLSKEVLVKGGIAVGVTVVAVGIGVGVYKLVRKRKLQKSLEHAEDVLAEVKEHYKEVEETEEVSE